MSDNNNEDEHSEQHHKPNYKFMGTIMLFLTIVFIFFAAAATYHDGSSQAGDDTEGLGTVSTYYAMYQDVHVMIFIGFGFLMTFLRKHAFNSLGMTFLIGCFSILIGIMMITVIDNICEGHTIHVNLDIPALIKGDFAAGAVLISYGAVLGRVTPTQILWMLFFEIFFYAINEYIGVYQFEAVDMGGSMFVHTFGAYFGLAFSWWLGAPKKNDEDESSVYHSDVYAMIGTIFLWMFWPSFNGALAENAQQHRVVINTVLALTNSCFAGVLTSKFLQP